MGKPRDPDYWKKYRADHHDRIREQEKVRARNRTPEQRRARHRSETARRQRRRGERAPFAPLTPLFPSLVHGTYFSFWEDELKMDLEQEVSLAVLEGRDPVEARRLYAGAEWQWRHHTTEVPESL